MKTVARALLAVSLASAFASAAFAEKWLKVDPKDPYSKEGNFHLFDIDSAFQDRATGLIAAHMVFMKPDDVSAGVKSRILWAFDCKTRHVYFVGNQDDGGVQVTPGWREKPSSLAKPQMGGVTNMFGKKLCALKGSWPLGDLPSQ